MFVRRTSDRSHPRRGVALYIVLVVVAMLSLAAYTFTESMFSESEATAMYGRSVEARAFAESGLELAMADLGTRTGFGADNFYHNPELFRAVVLRDADSPRARGLVSLVAPVETDLLGEQIRYGLSDESGKLNLNTLLQLGLSDEELQSLLLYIPGMTLETADAILDWIDEDDEPRLFGAESDYYLTLSPPYPAKNGPLESLDEMLLIAGVTPALLYGEDANRNGLLDPNEDDGDAQPPFDNADGLLEPGWSAFLTIHSREANRSIDGAPRINLNHSLLTELYDQLEPEFGEDVARFIVAYRLRGPFNPNSAGDSGGGDSGDNNSDDRNSDGRGRGRRGRGRDSGGDRNNSRGGSGGRSGGAGDPPAGLQQAADAVAGALFGGEGAVTRGGLDLSRGGSQKINSLFDLFDVQVSVEIDGGQQTLDSPWPLEQMNEVLPDLMDRLSLTGDEFIPGRININLARFEVLMAIPGMTEELADAIIAARMSDQGGLNPDVLASRATTGWLFTEGLVDLDQIRQLDRYITTQGDVYRVQSVGYFEAGGPVVRLEAVIDAAGLLPKLVFVRDLTHLGRGYAPEQLSPATTLLP